MSDTTHPSAHDVPGDLSGLLREVAPDGRRFGHREHVHLAFLAVRQHGTTAAAAKISTWLRHLTAYANAPQKYNATVTRAWTEIVGHHVQADPSEDSFAEFVSRYPMLLDKRLLRRHYSPAVLASPRARQDWVQPDLASFPWR